MSHRVALQGSSLSSTEECGYFFCLRGRKYRNSIRPNRVTGSGFWKATGIDKPIYSSSLTAGDCLGLKKSLVYYRGSAGRGTKTDWMMHEFRLPSSTSPANHPAAANIQDAEIWTICRIFMRSMTYTKGRAAAASTNKRSHQLQHIQRIQQQQQHYYHDHHRRYCTSSASMAAANSVVVDSSDAETTRSHNVSDCRCHKPPFLLDFPAGAASTVTGGVQQPAAAASGWRELVSFRDGGGGSSSSWDELGRIMEISTNSANYYM